MKRQLQRKLFVFILPIAIGMMFSATASAQFVYTDVDPDVAITCTVSTPNTSCSTLDSIDINNDGVFDVKLSVGGSSSGVYIIVEPKADLLKQLRSMVVQSSRILQGTRFTCIGMIVLHRITTGVQQQIRF